VHFYIFLNLDTHKYKKGALRGSRGLCVKANWKAFFFAFYTGGGFMDNYEAMLHAVSIFKKLDMDHKVYMLNRILHEINDGPHKKSLKSFMGTGLDDTARARLHWLVDLDKKVKASEKYWSEAYFKRDAPKFCLDISREVDQN